jgi:hypothetical protein
VNNDKFSSEKFPANLNKITDANLLEEIIGHDIILLTETHLGKDENIVPHPHSKCRLIS